MPELPEVETIRRYLDPILIGKRILSVVPIHNGKLIGNASSIKGATIVSSKRFGKVLNIQLSNNFFISFHLKMSGQILYAKNKDDAVFSETIPNAFSNTLPAKSTRVIITFTDKSAVYFNDARRFGWVKISQKAEKPSGPDVTTGKFTQEYFQSVVRKSSQPIKTLLLNQDKLAGVGNIYANDALFLAGIQPIRKSSSLSYQEIIALYQSIVNTIQQGIKSMGASGKDKVFILPNGQLGMYQQQFKVYQREGEQCLRCQNCIVRIHHNGRSSFYCPMCQK